MKRIVIIVLAFVLILCPAVADSSILSLPSMAGLTPELTDNPDGSFFCDFSAMDSNNSSISWSDSEHVYTVSGSPEIIAQAYVDALALGGWDSCRYIIAGSTRMSYGTASNQIFTMPEDYLSGVEQSLDVHVSAPEASQVPATEHTYVLNTNTKKFHFSDCSSVNKIKSKNRKDYTGTRDDLIANGYSPCGNCNP